MLDLKKNWIAIALVTLGGCGAAAFLLLLASTSRVEEGGVSIDVAPNGTEIVFAAASGDLFTFNLNSKRVQQLTKTTEIEGSPIFSQDGKSIIFSREDSDKTQSIFNLRVADGKETRLTNHQSVNDNMPSLSPDGKQIVFSRAARYRNYSMGGMTWDDYDIWVIPVEGGTAKQITREKYYQATYPCFMGDRSILFSAYIRNQSGMVPLTVLLKGSKPTWWGPPATRTDGGAWLSDPSRSADAKQVCFVSDRNKPFAYDVWFSDADGKHPKALNVTSVGHYNQRPVFEPDGKSILFLAGTSSNIGNRAIFSLYRIGLDSKLTKVAGEALFIDPLAYGKTIKNID